MSVFYCTAILVVLAIKTTLACYITITFGGKIAYIKAFIKAKTEPSHGHLSSLVTVFSFKKDNGIFDRNTLLKGHQKQGTVTSQTSVIESILNERVF